MKQMKQMKTLTLCEEPYEIVDAAARDEIEALRDTFSEEISNEINNIETVRRFNFFDLTIPTINAPSVGWYRIARLTGLDRYFSCILFLSGGYTNGVPSNAVISLNGTYNTPALFQLSGTSGNIITKLRLTGSKGTYFLDAYQGRIYESSETMASQHFKIFGNIKAQSYSSESPLGAGDDILGEYTVETTIRDIADIQSFVICDSSETNSGEETKYERNADIAKLKLPSVITATLIGHSTSATNDSIGNNISEYYASKIELSAMKTSLESDVITEEEIGEICGNVIYVGEEVEV